MPFTLTAKLNKLTIKIDRPQLSPEDIKKLEEAGLKTPEAAKLAELKKKEEEKKRVELAAKAREGRTADPTKAMG